MSNCSGDSGAQLSVNSSNESSKLGVLKEQDSPDFPPYDEQIYGRSVSIKPEPKTDQPPGHPHQGELPVDNSIQPRFATVRKSFTLPHNMASASVASTPTVLSPRKRKDLSQFLGLNDEGPGSPSKDVVQSVAMQNLPSENSNEKIEKFLGINQNGPMLPPQVQQPKRPRPKSLHGLDRSQSIDQERPRVSPCGTQAPLSKTLARLQKIKESSAAIGAKSAPTTPDAPFDMTSSPSKRALKLFGLGKHQQGLLLKTQSSLSTSTPLDLEAKPEEMASNIITEASDLKRDRSWQSNEGLSTSGSGGLPTPMDPMSPAIKRIMPTHGLVLRVASQDEYASANSNSASNSPFHASLGRGISANKAYNTSSLQRGGLGTITKTRGATHPRKLPRSATLDDLEPYYEPVMWVQRGHPCHPCCCASPYGQYRMPTHHAPSMEQHCSLPRYPHHASMPRRPLPPVRYHQDYESLSVASPEPVYLSMNRRSKVVVIPINGGGGSVAATPTTPSKVVPVGSLRESSVDPEYVALNGSKVLSMGNKTCISVNESNMVSTKAIVHQE